MRDLKIAKEVADELRALNCSLALDDFGAGYSSLARLRQLPFSELKIDRSYVIDCDVDKMNAGLCETIVELAKRFDLKTVAEGSKRVTRATSCRGSAATSAKGICLPGRCRRTSSSASSARAAGAGRTALRHAS